MVLGQSEVWTVGAGGQQEDTLAGSGHTGPTKSQFYIKFITRRDDNRCYSWYPSLKWFRDSGTFVLSHFLPHNYKICLQIKDTVQNTNWLKEPFVEMLSQLRIRDKIYLSGRYRVQCDVSYLEVSHLDTAGQAAGQTHRQHLEAQQPRTQEDQHEAVGGQPRGQRRHTAQHHVRGAGLRHRLVHLLPSIDRKWLNITD